MAKIVDHIICSECNKQYEWEYIIPQKFSEGGALVVETFIPGRGYAKCLSSHFEEPHYRFAVRCPFCDNLETFDYDLK